MNTYHIEFFNQDHEQIGTILVDIQPKEKLEQMLDTCYPGIIYRCSEINLK